VRGPVRRGSAPLQEAGGTEHDRAGANRTHVAGPRSLGAQEAEHFGVLKQRVDAPPSGHTENIERRAFGEGRGRDEHEPSSRSDCCAVLPDQAHFRVRDRSEHFVGAGQVELLHVGEDENADVKGHEYLPIDDAILREQGVAQMPKNPRFTPSRPRRIEILAFPDVQLLDVAGPLQVFASANELARAARHPRPYELALVAERPRVTASGGLGLVAHKLSKSSVPLDTLILAGGFGVRLACENAALIRWITARAAAARRVASVCTGAFLLATAGLLDGRRAVTHWRRCAEFARRFPAVRLDPDPIFVRDGNIWTSAGITAGIDLALALVEADLGQRIALAVARQLVVFLKRPGGQAQFSATLALQHGDARFERLHAWITDHLHAHPPVTSLPDPASLTPR